MDVAGIAIYLRLTDPRSLVVPLELERSEQIRELASALAPGDTFVDVGANHGSFSVAAARLVGPEGLVVSFEPQPALAPLVRRSLRELGSAPFVVHELACSDHDGEADFFIPRATSGAAGLLSDISARSPGETVRVQVRRFDEAVDWRAFPGDLLVKLDVEGSEAAFLRGAARALSARRPRILMEVNPGAIEAAGRGPGSSLRQTLLELGYTRARPVGFPDVEDLATMDWTRRRNVLVS